ncbi:P22AR C-terminal domain-containing protein [Avibacterium paragallinarum]
MTTLTFQNTTLSVINQHNQIWFTGLEIGKALGYKDPSSNIAKLFDRNRDEFTPNMTALIDMKTVSGVQKVRIFSLRGCHLIGMLSHTKVAKEFRKWVLDILDQEVEQQKPKQLALPEPEKKYTFEFTEDTCLRFVSMWFALYNNLELLRQLHQPLSNLGSHFGSTAYTHCTEYQTILGIMKSVLEPMTAEFNPNPHQEAHYYKALKTLRSYQLKGLARLVNHPTPPTRKYDI